MFSSLTLTPLLQILLTLSQPIWRSWQRSLQRRSSTPTNATLLSTAVARALSVYVTWGHQLCAISMPNVSQFNIWWVSTGNPCRGCNCEASVSIKHSSNLCQLTCMLSVEWQHFRLAGRLTPGNLYICLKQGYSFLRRNDHMHNHALVRADKHLSCIDGQCWGRHQGKFTKAHTLLKTIRISMSA